MTVDFDMSQYLGIFLDEIEEQLQTIDQGLIQLEQEHGNIMVLNNIFRAAHTVKGSSASMGFDKLATLTHDMESVLDKLRNGQLEVNREIIDLLLACLDSLRQLKEEIVSGEDRQVDIVILSQQLKVIASGQIPGSPAARQGTTAENVRGVTLELSEEEEDVILAAHEKGMGAYHLQVQLVSDCAMKSVRAYLVFRNLEGVGEIIKTVPSTETIEAEDFGLNFELVIVTRESLDRIVNLAKSISEIEEVLAENVIVTTKVDQLGPVGGEPVPEQPPRQEKEQSTPALKVSQTVRVDVQRLESLMNLVGELVIDRTRLARANSGIKSRLGTDQLVENLDEISTHLGRITGELQEEIMKARMLPVEQVFNRFPRMVRDLAQKAGKEIDFIVEGKETELDRTVIEEISDPLIHLIRNSIDHGIELPEERERAGKPRHGTVRLRAYHHENQIVITVQDDGRGMDAGVIRRKAVEKGLITAEMASRLSEQEAINFIFYPGFSTAREISAVSGRGVGMDIVRSHIERINGLIDIRTVVGQGTRFTIKLPLTLAISRSLLVYLDNSVYAFPLVNVVETISLQRENIQTVQGREVVLVRGNVLPLFRLSSLLGFREGNGKPLSKYPVVVVGLSEKRMGIIVDNLLGEQEIVIKSLGNYLGQIRGIAGGTILGDGQVAMILDVRGLLAQVGVE
ncbi:MAG: chemotaxis protein CheW [Bacillota bacterium]